ncbi:hypothetical protein BJ165DRAFT_1605891 [Panaeolus papilionaceus]|nr:hypothetical protein BJ165DRAFT_1605891 [Panaeolus papilionaceus]
MPPLPTSPLTPNSTREANITGALNSLDGHCTSGDGIRGDPRVAEKDDDQAKAMAGRRRKIDSLGYSLSPLKSPSQSSLTSQRYMKPAARTLLSSPSSSSLPHGSSTMLRYIKPAARVLLSSPLSSSLPHSSSITLVAPFSPPSASSSTLNLPIAVRSVPAIPKIHVLCQDQPQPQEKSLKRSASFSLLTMSKGKKEEDRYGSAAERDMRRMVDAVEEQHAQLQRSEHEVLAGFKHQSAGQQPRSSSASSQPPLPVLSQPSSRSASRSPSRQLLFNQPRISLLLFQNTLKLTMRYRSRVLQIVQKVHTREC